MSVRWWLRHTIGVPVLRWELFRGVASLSLLEPFVDLMAHSED